MMDITKQNTDENMRLLIAMRHFYTKAKKMHKWRNTVTIILALISPVIIFFIPGSKPILAVIGGIFVFFRHILKDSELKIIKDAATVQEQFDTALFGLDWNETIVGNKLAPELINEANRNFKGDKIGLENWYTDTGKIPYPINVLLCQRSNLVWDWRLHQRYGFVVAIATIGWGIITVGFGMVTKQTLSDYMLGLFLPSLSALMQGAETALDHLKIAREKEGKEKESSNILERGLKDPNAVITIDQCREFQNYIYINRKEPFVPDWWYKMFRNKYESDMRYAITELRKRYEPEDVNKVQTTNIKS